MTFYFVYFYTGYQNSIQDFTVYGNLEEVVQKIGENVIGPILDGKIDTSEYTRSGGQIEISLVYTVPNMVF